MNGVGNQSAARIMRLRPCWYEATRPVRVKKRAGYRAVDDLQNPHETVAPYQRSGFGGEAGPRAVRGRASWGCRGKGRASS